MQNKNYLKSVIGLGVGTLISQLILILVSPIYARIFDPAAFGLFAVYTSATIMLMPMMSGKYDVAALTRKSSAQSILLFQVSEIFTIVFSMVTAILVAAAYVGKNEFILKHDVAFFCMPAGLLIGSIFLINFNRLTKSGKFIEISKQKILLESLIALITIAFGLLGISNGMIFGSVFGGAILIAVITQKAGLNYLVNIFKINLSKKILAKKYSDYLKFNATTSILDGLIVAMPIFFISTVYGGKEAGFFFLACKLINAPVSFISSSIAQVNLKFIVDLKKDIKKLTNFLISQSIAMLLFGMLLILVWHLVSERFVEIIFGREWLEVGILIKIIVWSLPIKFMASTLSTVLGAVGGNRIAALWRVTTFLFMCLFLFVLANDMNFLNFLEKLVIFEIAAYSFYYILIFYSAVVAPKEVR